MAYTIEKFLDDLDKALFHFQIGDIVTHEEKCQCGLLHGSTDLKKVSLVWEHKEIANALMDIDTGKVVVHARKFINEELKTIHPFFLKSYVRSCLGPEIKWIRGRNKIGEIFDDIHYAEDFPMPLENRRRVIFPLVDRSIRANTDTESGLISFIEGLIKWYGKDNVIKVQRIQQSEEQKDGNG